MKIAVVGTGAMGSVYAGLLGRAGHEVWAIDTWRDHIDAIAGNGLRVSGASGDYVVDTLHAGSTPEDAGACDLWIIATKAWSVEEAAAAVAPLLRPDDMVMAFQNGLGAADRVARQLPAEHVIIGIAEGFGSSIPEPGHVHHEGMRLIRIGDVQGGLTDRVLRVEAAFREARFNVKAFADVDVMIWEKFICNVTLSAPCAAFDVTIGELMSDPDTWAVALGCTLEAYRVGQAKGVAFTFDDPVAYVTQFAATIPDASPSMRLDHVAGRRSEIDVINGQVVTLGRELGVPTPYNETLSAIVRRREAAFAAPDQRRPR
ncbi:MAG TPA: 2-dehydropantoate 2-reductase [Acidimicrobiales bacterium]|nr:2-dehydropantoate 2-reductase [Acidimicrobiales bacterium]